MSDTLAAALTISLKRDDRGKGAMMTIKRPIEARGISFWFKDADGMAGELRSRLPSLMSRFRESVSNPDVTLRDAQARIAAHRMSNFALEIEHILCERAGIPDGILFERIREYVLPLFNKDIVEHSPPLIRVEATIMDPLAWLIPFELFPVVVAPKGSGGPMSAVSRSYLGFRAEIVRCQRMGDRSLASLPDGRVPIRLFPYLGRPDELPGVQEQIRFFRRTSHEGLVQVELEWPRQDDEQPREDSLAAQLLQGDAILHFCCKYDSLGSRQVPEPQLQFGHASIFVFELRSAIKRSRQQDAIPPPGTKLNPGDPRPFIFLNACHTAASANNESLFKLLMSNGYRNILVSEALVPDRVAARFAKELYTVLLRERGVRLGSAVLKARLALLEIGNPAGLLYTYFGDPSLKVEVSRASIGREPMPSRGLFGRIASRISDRIRPNAMVH